MLFISSPLDTILLSNIAIQGSSVALVLAAYLDKSIDVPHNIIASYFAVLLSTYRIISYNIHR